MSVRREQLSDDVTLYCGACEDVLPTLPAGSVDCCVTDPPYGLGFMGKQWDKPGAFVERKPERCNRFDHVGGNHNPVDGFDRARTQRVEGQKFQVWCAQWAAAVLPALKPGGYLLAMGGTRTYHRLACAVEDAGFEVRDCLMWVYGSGFPKGQGCLKPAYEPILLCRKPGPKVLPLGIDECRVPTGESTVRSQNAGPTWSGEFKGGRRLNGSDDGRWPANLAHDGSDEVLEAFAAFGENKGDGCGKPRNRKPREDETQYRIGGGRFNDTATYADIGTAARFFYCAKASRKERGDGNAHPTVKPLALMKWLVRLACPAGGTVLDPFLGSGSTAVACLRAGRKCVGVEREPAYFDTARCRIAAEIEARKGQLFAASEGA